MARLLRGYALGALENVALWHERDISHSSVERVILPDSAHALHYMLKTFNGVLQNLEVRTEAMAANLGATRGAVYSESVLLALVDKGVPRNQAYEMIQRAALKAQENDSEFQKLISEDRDISGYLTEEEISACFDLEKALQRVGDIFARIGLS
jgi:adenylosuccinate lyase